VSLLLGIYVTGQTTLTLQLCWNQICSTYAKHAVH